MYRALNERAYQGALVFASSAVGMITIALWSFLEASFWFIAPDFILLLFLVLLPSQKGKLFWTVLIASLVGGGAYFIANLIDFDAMRQILYQTPFVNSEMIARVREFYLDYGLLGVLMQSISFISFKIWTHLAVEVGFQPVWYFLLVCISRALRIYVVVMVGVYLSRFATLARRHFVPLVSLYAVASLTLLFIVE